MKKKKILTGLVAAAAILSLAACGSDKKDTKENSSAVSTASTEISSEASSSKSEVTSVETSEATSVTSSSVSQSVYTSEAVSTSSSQVISSETKSEATSSSSSEVESLPTSSSSETVTSTEDDNPYENVTYFFGVDNLETSILEDDTYVGLFKISASSEVSNRIRAVENYNGGSKEFAKALKITTGSKQYVSFTCPQSVNKTAGKLTIFVQNGSSGLQTNSVKVTMGGKEKTYEYDGQNNGSPTTKLEIDIPAAISCNAKESLREIKFTGVSGTSYIYGGYYETLLEKGTENGFSVPATGKIEYLQGQEIDKTRLTMQKTYSNGKIETLDPTSSDVTFDTTDYDPTQPGTYTIKVKYKDYDWYSYNVNVWAPSSMKLGFNQTYQGANSSAGNSQYINGKVKTIYKVGEEFDASFLSANVTASKDGQTENFLLKTKSLVCEGFDSTKVGEQTITVKYDGADLTQTYTVYVIDKDIPYVTIDGNSYYNVNVDDDYTGEIGAIVDNAMCFKTIGQALEMYEKLGRGADGKYDITSTEYNRNKVMNVAAGYYNEKLEITVANLSIIGEGMTKSTHSEDTENYSETVFKQATIIEWDSLYGIDDEGGFNQVTDSCQSVAIRDTAVNVSMINLTLSNYWNCQAIFDKDLGTGYGEHRALALLCQSDKFYMENCALLGYQDTVEFFKGRQYLKNCYVTGCTDFIFGTNCTTLFEDSEIHVIAKKNTTAYITAMKGCSKGESDSVTYGVIFNRCKFTADQSVGAGTSSIGRTWGNCAAVMTMNCEIGNHVSVAPYGATSTSYYRYLAMNGAPTDATCKFTEYNNTGAGAVTSGSHDTDGYTVLEAEAAALYEDKSVIFGTTNNKVSYDEAWDCSNIFLLKLDLD